MSRTPVGVPTGISKSTKVSYVLLFSTAVPPNLRATIHVHPSSPREADVKASAVVLCT